MRIVVLVAPALLSLSGCVALREAFAIPPPQVASTPAVAPGDPTPAMAAPPPSALATTVEEFDTTTAAQRAAAVAIPAPASETRLGSTIAALGPPAEPGIWLKTPLVSAVTMGRVEDASTGRSVALELRPSGGPDGSGSQISLAAMRLLELPLTALTALVVYRDPGTSG